MQPSTAPPRLKRDQDAAPAAGVSDAALRLPASLDLTWADTLHGELQGRIARDSAVLIDGHDVERVSTSCVQLLVAAAIGARADGLPFELVGVSDILRDAVRDLGLAHILGMEER